MFFNKKLSNEHKKRLSNEQIQPLSLSRKTNYFLHQYFPEIIKNQTSF